MLDLINELPQQCGKGWDLGVGKKLEVKGPVEQVLILGMGGSAIGGDIMAALGRARARIPFYVSRDYSIPTWVGKGTLVLVISYSGNTEETIMACRDARLRGAQMVALSSGGQMEEDFAEEANYISIPPALPPRAAMGYLLFPLLAVLHNLGYLPMPPEELEECLENLEDIRQEMGGGMEKESQALELARSLEGKLPLIYGGSTLGQVAAVRWKCQINENSKSMAFANVYPELNHNETVGWLQPLDLVKKTVVIQLFEEQANPRVKKRMEITKAIMKERGVQVCEVRSRGSFPLSRLLSLSMVGDYVSLYLAHLYGIDPTPVKVIDYLKGELGRI